MPNGYFLQENYRLPSLHDVEEMSGAASAKPTTH